MMAFLLGHQKMDIPKNTQGISIPGREGESFDYLSTTPGGSIYGTTPGGTKIKYTRDALLFIRNSPLSKTPPSHLPVIPGITAPGSLTPVQPQGQKKPKQPTKESPKVPIKDPEDDTEEVFTMD